MLILWLALKPEAMEQDVEHPRSEGAQLKGHTETQPVLISQLHTLQLCRWRGCLLVVLSGTGGWLAGWLAGSSRLATTN